MSGFEKHGINHTSASSINMWSSSQGAWVARYLYNKKFPFSAPARAGVLAESAVVNVITGNMTKDEAIEFAVKSFNRETVFNKSDAVIKRCEAIEPMVTMFLKELEPYGKPTFDENGNQIKISILCKGNGWELPVIGYLDLYYPEQELVIDLKTTFRMPSTLSPEHNRQAAIYEKATGFKVKFLYATPKKTSWLECENVNETVSEIKTILNRQEKMLAMLEKHEIKDIVDVQSSSFYWSGGAEEIRKELYGF